MRSGPAAVIDSGVVTTFAGHGLTLVVHPGGDRIEIALDFRSEAGGEPSVQAFQSPRGWRIECRNFDDAGGRGSADPVLLGEIGDDLYFFHFRVSLHGRSADRTVTYTLFQVAKAAVDWTPG